MRVYHFLDREFGLLDIEHRRLKIARINDLNDRFEMRPRCADMQARRVIRDLKDQAHARFGLLCFSRNWENPVQWSHYADRHRGLCLGFDVDDTVLERVIYRRHRPRADMYRLFRDQPTGEAHMRAWFRTKYVHWEYEQEERVFIGLDDPPENGLHFEPFSPRIRLAEVIVGDQCSLTRQNILDLLGNDLAPYVNLTKARLAFQSYRVVKQRMKRMWP